MNVLQVIVPTFALIAAGFGAALTGLVSEGAQKGISEFAFSLAIPALLFRTIVVSKFPATSPLLIWSAYYGAAALTWLIALLLSAAWLKLTPAARVVAATGSVYGNIAMLGIPLVLAAIGPDAAGPMALILAINTPLLWFVGILRMAWVDRQSGASIADAARRLLQDLSRNPIIVAIVLGFLWKLTGIGLHPLADKACAQLAQAGTPAALVALGMSLIHFKVRGEFHCLAVICTLKLLFMPFVAWVLAVPLLHLPSPVAGVVVLFAATPTGANAYLFASRYKTLENSTSAAVALGTLLSGLTIPIAIAVSLANFSFAR